MDDLSRIALVLGIVTISFILLVSDDDPKPKPIAPKEAKVQIAGTLTFEHSSMYMGKVNDCEMYRVTTTETDDNSDVKLYTMLLAKCPGTTSSSTSEF
jgi:hypothetical protein